ncbi:MAG: TIR domain-containing protein [Symploca sp. SIO2G7]|nr:TIR domain-containing protein [Symploca sp. SIO2G7]
MSRVEEKLRDAEVQTWRDRDKQAILPAIDWRDQVEKAIINCKNFIFFISPESIESPQCQWELAVALQYHKRLIPVVCLNQRMRPKQVRSRNMHEALARLNWIDFQDFNEGVYILISTLTVETFPVRNTVHHFLWVMHPNGSFKYQLFRNKYVIGRAPYWKIKKESLSEPKDQQAKKYRELFIELAQTESPIIIDSDNYLSRRHATIFKRGNQFLIADGDCDIKESGLDCKSSSNGVVIERHKLRPEEEIFLTNNTRIKLSCNTYLCYKCQDAQIEASQDINENDTLIGDQ